METKQIFLDGGPADGQVIEVKKDVTMYECFTPPKFDPNTRLYEELPPPVKHVYREDPNVEGHFIYVNQTNSK